MASAGKPEFPPLLPAGLHPRTLSELRKMCVIDFPHSKRRDPVMRSLEAMCTSISVAFIRAEVWVDGSFLTKKIEPDDVDVLVTLNAECANGTSQQQQIIAKVNAKGFNMPVQCDSYLLFQYPKGHPLYWTAKYMRAYWLRQFGFSRGNQLKGIAVIRTPIV